MLSGGDTCSGRPNTCAHARTHEHRRTEMSAAQETNTVNRREVRAGKNLEKKLLHLSISQLLRNELLTIIIIVLIKIDFLTKNTHAYTHTNKKDAQKIIIVTTWVDTLQN